jgi:hypothetical protein
MWMDINQLHPPSAHVDMDSKNQYLQVRMQISILGYEGTDNNRIHIPLYIYIPLMNV